MPDLQPTVEDEDEDVNWGPPSQDPEPHFAGAPQPQRYLNPRIDKVDASSGRNPQRRAAPANRFASLSDFNNNEDDDDDEGRQNLFAGGEKSSAPPIPFQTNFCPVASQSKTPTTHPPPPKTKSVTSSAQQCPTQPASLNPPPTPPPKTPSSPAQATP
jgi:hypothetical protein